MTVLRRPACKPSGGEELKRDLLGFMAPKLAKFALPDDVVFVEEIPHTSTGKISKLTLRQQFQNYRGAQRSRL